MGLHSRKYGREHQSIYRQFVQCVAVWIWSYLCVDRAFRVRDASEVSDEIESRLVDPRVVESLEVKP